MTVENEAKALLELAEAGQVIDAERARRFARAVLQETERGRVALEVLDGGLLAGASLTGLAKAVEGG